MWGTDKDIEELINDLETCRNCLEDAQKEYIELCSQYEKLEKENERLNKIIKSFENKEMIVGEKK